MTDCNPSSTLMDLNVVLNAGEGNPFNSSLYARALGSLLFAAVCTRPDILYAVQVLSQYTSAPLQDHWTTIKNIFQYLKGTCNFALTYGGIGTWTATFEAYIDADWASNNDRKSIAGYAFLLAGGAISWSA